MHDDDKMKIWNEYVNETLANPDTIDRVKRSLKDPDIDDNERETIKSVLRTLLNQADVEDIQTVKLNIFDTLKKLLNNEETNRPDDQPPSKEETT